MNSNGRHVIYFNTEQNINSSKINTSVSTLNKSKEKEKINNKMKENSNFFSIEANLSNINKSKINKNLCNSNNIQCINMKSPQNCNILLQDGNIEKINRNSSKKEKKKSPSNILLKNFNNFSFFKKYKAEFLDSLYMNKLKKYQSPKLVKSKSPISSNLDLKNSNYNGFLYKKKIENNLKKKRINDSYKSNDYSTTHINDSINKTHISNSYSSSIINNHIVRKADTAVKLEEKTKGLIYSNKYYEDSLVKINPHNEEDLVVKNNETNAIDYKNVNIRKKNISTEIINKKIECHFTNKNNFPKNIGSKSNKKNNTINYELDIENMKEKINNKLIVKNVVHNDVYFSDTIKEGLYKEESCFFKRYGEKRNNMISPKGTKLNEPRSITEGNQIIQKGITIQNQSSSKNDRNESSINVSCNSHNLNELKHQQIKNYSYKLESFPKQNYKSKDKTSNQENDVLSEPETMISNSQNYLNDNMTTCEPEDTIRKQLKNIQLKFEKFLNEKNSRNAKNQKNHENNNIFDIQSIDVDFDYSNIETIGKFARKNLNYFSYYKEFIGDVSNLYPNTQLLIDKILTEMNSNYLEFYNIFNKMCEKLSLFDIYQEKYSKIYNLYEQVCRQKREKDNEIIELNSRIRYMENNQCSNISNNLNHSGNILKYNSNQNISHSFTLASSENMPTNKDDKNYNLTFNYNNYDEMNSNLTNNNSDLKDHQSVATNKISNFSGLKFVNNATRSSESINNIGNDLRSPNIYDMGNMNKENNTFSLNSSFNNSKRNIGQNNNNNNNGIKNNNLCQKNTPKNKTNKCQNSTFSTNVQYKLENSNIQIDKSSLFEQKQISIENTNGNKFRLEKKSSHEDSQESNPIKIDQGEKINNKLIFKSCDYGNEINFDDMNSNSIDLKSKIKIEQIVLAEKAICEDLDYISFPDKVKMRFVSKTPEVPRLNLNFKNKNITSYEWNNKNYNRNKHHNKSNPLYLDLYNSSVLNMSDNIIKDKSLELKKIDFNSKKREKEEFFRVINRDKLEIILQLQANIQ